MADIDFNVNVDSQISQTITDGVTTTAPSENAVFDALALKQNSLGYTPENVSNKSTSVVTDQASNVKYPSVKAVFDWVVGLGYQTAAAVNTLITSALATFKTTNYLDATSSIQTQLDGKLSIGSAALQRTYSPLHSASIISHTGTTSETVLLSSVNLVDVLLSGDVFMYAGCLFATNNANGKTLRFYLSDSPTSKVNEVLISTINGTSAFVNSPPFDKALMMTSISTQNTILGTALNTQGGPTLGTASKNLAGPSAVYIIATAELANAADTIRLQFCRSQIHRAS